MLKYKTASKYLGLQKSIWNNYTEDLSKAITDCLIP